MDVLDFAELQGQRSVAFALANLDLSRQRSHALLVLLLGGAGAMSGVAISQAAAGMWVSVAAGSIALWWFALAAWLAMRALRTQVVRSWAGEGWPLVEHAKSLDDYVKQAAIEGETVPDTLTLLREMELRKALSASAEYRVASTIAAAALDQAYKGAAFTPVVPALVLGSLWMVRHFG